MSSSEPHRSHAAGLSLWTHPVDPQPLAGGLSNRNFLAVHRGERFVVRLGDDMPAHGVSRARELAVSRAAHAAGLAPEVVHAEPGAMVLRYIPGRALTPDDVRQRAYLARIVPVLRACHTELPRYLPGDLPAPDFSVFEVIAQYAQTLRALGSPYTPKLPALLAAATRLSAAVGPLERVFGHNDLLAANWVDDGARLWLIDWEYAGYNSPLFDLGGLASNSALSDDDERWLLEQYFGAPVTPALHRRYDAMKCASLLREALWAMVSHATSALEVDYAAYADDYLERFERARAQFEGG